MEFVFPFSPSAEVPQKYVYRKPIKADIALAALTARQIEAFLGAGTQETLVYLKPHEVEQCCDAAVVMTELEGGHLYEWRVELRASACLAHASTTPKTHLLHGYIETAVLRQKGVTHRAVARSLATQALQSQYLLGGGLSD